MHRFHAKALRRACRVAVFATTCLLAHGTAGAAGFADVVFFGDSLTDTGNRYQLMGAADDGLLGGLSDKQQVWAWQVAQGLGLNGAANASLLGGNNYAYGGATTGFDLPDSGFLIPSMQSQVAQWSAAHTAANPDVLYVLVGGHNDIQFATKTYSGSDAQSQIERQNVVLQAIDNLKSDLLALSGKGAQHVLVSTVMDLGNSFAAQQAGLGTIAHETSMAFNALLPGLVSYGQSLHLDMRFFDLEGVLADIRDDALNHGAAKYGITNITLPCGDFEGSLGAACSVSLYSDGVHPTAHAHEIIANAALESLGVSAVPELQTYALMLAGLGLTLVCARRRQSN